MMPHTPGPWTYTRDLDYWSIEPINVGGKDNMENNEADYHLIAAAPDLLQALKEFVASSDFDEHLERNQRALAAIAKATAVATEECR